VLTLSALLLATVLGAPTAAPEPSVQAGAATAPRDPFTAVDPAAARPVPMDESRGELRDPFRSDPARRQVAGASRHGSPLRDPFVRDPARRSRSVPLRATADVHSPFVERRPRPPAPAPVITQSPAGELVDPFVRAR
jgi:hypothetical protein